MNAAILDRIKSLVLHVDHPKTIEWTVNPGGQLDLEKYLSLLLEDEL